MCCVSESVLLLLSNVRSFALMPRNFCVFVEQQLSLQRAVFNWINQSKQINDTELLFAFLAAQAGEYRSYYPLLLTRHHISWIFQSFTRLCFDFIRKAICWLYFKILVGAVQKTYTSRASRALFGASTIKVSKNYVFVVRLFIGFQCIE